jgi:coenzyme F420-reducing hydrogenase delta subunit
MDMGHSGLSVSPHIHPIKVMCAGRVDPPMLLSAFEKGAEGVMVIGCKDKECRYGPGHEQGIKLLERMRGLMYVVGLEPERFSTMAYASHEKERLFTDMSAFVEKIAQMEKSPLAR